MPSLGKVIITGANGFIGRHLCDSMIDLGYEVRTVPREMLYSFFDLQKYLNAEQPDYIFHLAAYGNHSNQQDDEEIINVNILDTWLLLQASKHIHYKKFINFGSSSEYGEGKMSEDSVLRPETLYGASKESTTAICRAFANKYNKNIITVRPFSVFGEREAEFRLIPRIIRSIKYGETFPLVLNQKHDWIYISDFIDGLLSAMDSDVSLLNIGTGAQFTNLEVVRLLESISGRTAHYTGTGEEQYPDWVADNSLLKSLGWIQKHSLREGLTKTYERSI